MFEEQYFTNYCFGQSYQETIDIHLTTFDRISAAYSLQSGEPADNWLMKQKIIDIGCGFGYVVQSLVHRGVDCVGYDCSDYAMSNKIKSVEDLLWKGNNDTELPKFQDDSFDIVFSNSFQYARTEKQVVSWIKDAYRICRHSLFFVAVTVEGLYRNVSGNDIWKLQLVKSKRWWSDRFIKAGFSDVFWSMPVSAICIK